MFNEDYYWEIQSEEFHCDYQPTDAEMEEIFLEAVNEDIQRIIREAREEYEAELIAAR